MPGKRILVVDDAQHILDVVVYVLEENAFQPLTARDGAGGLRRFQKDSPDLVLLDLNLPDVAGLDLFREMRRLRPDLPIIMLTARNEEMDRVLGLELGADDYVTKPFSPRELVARVRAVLRRLPPAGQVAAAPRLACGPLQLDGEAFAATYFGRPVALTRAEFRLLEALARYPARVFSREALIDRLYDGEHVVTDRSIDACVKRVRRKLADVRDQPDPIATVHGIGYKLNHELEKCG